MSTYLYVGDGTTQKDVYSDYDNGAPESIPYNDQLDEVFSALLVGGDLRLPGRRGDHRDRAVRAVRR